MPYIVNVTKKKDKMNLWVIASLHENKYDSSVEKNTLNF